MKQILLLLCAVALSLSAAAQTGNVETWNPDANGDGCVTTLDMLSLLSVFGLCSEWGSVDCPDSLGFTCFDAVNFNNYAYQTVLIGSQCWFAENLRTTTYADGTVIPAGLTDGEWISTTAGATAVYGEGSSSCNNYSPDIDACDDAQSLAAYGRLYNWYAVDDDRGLCPAGWHVPTDEEWMVLEMELGMSESEANSLGWRGTDEGAQLKSASGWSSGGNGTDDFGFSALPGGYCAHTSGTFQNAGVNGYWWSSSPSAYYFWSRSLSHDESGISRFYNFPRYGFSVRCVRD